MDQDSGCWRKSSFFSSQPFLPCFFPELLHFSRPLREKLPHSYEGWSLNFFCPLWSPWDTQDREMSCGFSESRSPVFIAGKKAEGEGGGDDHVRPGMASSPGEGRGGGKGGVEGGLRNQEKYLWEFFFTSSGFPTVTGFDKRRNNKKINHK